MKIHNYCIAAFFATSISGCADMADTMFTHYRLSPQVVRHLAIGNAVANVCLAGGAIDKDVVREYSIATATFLNETVYDKDLYRSVYGEAASKASSGISFSIAECGKFENKFKENIPEMYRRASEIAADISSSRREDIQRMSAGLSNFGAGYSSQNYNSSTDLRLPKFNLKPIGAANNNMLIRKPDGDMIQCNLAHNSVVFCF